MRGERDRESEREPVLSKPNPSHNAFPKLCEWFIGRFLLKERGMPDGSHFESKILVKSPALIKVDYKNYFAIAMSRNYYRKLLQKIITGNYYRKLWQEIMTRNYQLVYQWRRKCGNYRDTRVSKKVSLKVFWIDEK